jgi:iron-sulfur cluster assembly protein
MAVITVTERAIEKIRELCHHNNKYAVRLSIKGGGCAGYSYDWGFADQSEIAPADELLNFGNGAKFTIDAASVMYILGTELDYVTEVFGSHFDIRNPNAKSACGCGESISFEKETA